MMKFNEPRMGNTINTKNLFELHNWRELFRKQGAKELKNHEPITGIRLN